MEARIIRRSDSEISDENDESYLIERRPRRTPRIKTERYWKRIPKESHPAEGIRKGFKPHDPLGDEARRPPVDRIDRVEKVPKPKRRWRLWGCFLIFLSALVILGGLLLLFLDYRTSIGPRPESLAGTSIFSPSANILLIGSDTRQKDKKGRADTIMILHVSALRSKNVLLSIPRDTKVLLEGHGEGKINAAYAYGGPDLLVRSVENLTDLRINHVVELDFEGFVKLVDAMGGVTITVQEPLVDPLSGANFQPGTYHMDGEQALAFVRSRATASADLGRIERQQHFLKEMLKQLLSPATLIRSPQLFLSLTNYVKTDMNAMQMITSGTLSGFGLKGFEAYTIPGKPAMIGGISYIVVDEAEVKSFVKEKVK